MSQPDFIMIDGMLLRLDAIVAVEQGETATVISLQGGHSVGTLLSVEAVADVIQEAYSRAQDPLLGFPAHPAG